MIIWIRAVCSGNCCAGGPLSDECTLCDRDRELDARFIKEASAAGFVNLKGHRTVGGMRASIYNAMPISGVKALTEFMQKFEEENR